MLLSRRTNQWAVKVTSGRVVIIDSKTSNTIDLHSGYITSVPKVGGYGVGTVVFTMN